VVAGVPDEVSSVEDVWVFEQAFKLPNARLGLADVAHHVVQRISNPRFCHPVSSSTTFTP
jgi:hypothetical protein